MRFDLVDAVLERTDDRIVTIKHVTASEEHLRDHFPTYPVLPGVLMIEAMVQAARRLLEAVEPASGTLVLGSVHAMKYAAFVRPGQTLRCEVVLRRRLEGGAYEMKGIALALDTGSSMKFDAPKEPSKAVSGRFVMRPLNLCELPKL